MPTTMVVAPHRPFVAPPLDFSSPPIRPNVTLIQFSDRPEYEPFMARNAKLARANGYRYERRGERVLDTHPVYFEKVRMALDAFDEGAEWVLWVDDDATINLVNQTVADWIERFPHADFIITREVRVLRRHRPAPRSTSPHRARCTYVM